MRKLIFLSCILLTAALSFFAAGYYLLFDYKFIDTRTSAVCSENRCQDFTFICLNGKMIDSRAISGLVYFDDKWIDLREETKIC